PPSCLFPRSSSQCTTAVNYSQTGKNALDKLQTSVSPQNRRNPMIFAKLQFVLRILNGNPILINATSSMFACSPTDSCVQLLVFLALLDKSSPSHCLYPTCRIDASGSSQSEKVHGTTSQIEHFKMGQGDARPDPIYSSHFAMRGSCGRVGKKQHCERLASRWID